MSYFLVLLTIFLWLPLVQRSLSASHYSKLCGRNDSSCQSQLENQNSSEADCLVKYYPANTEECEEWVFEGSPEAHLGNVNLEAYVYSENTYTWSAFNVTFTHISWNYLRMRFRLSNKNTSKNYKNSCREFHLPVEVSDSQQLFFDCPWAGPADQYYEEHYYGFEYEARSSDGRREHHQYLLEVPYYPLIANATDIAEWPLFVYLDVTKAPVLTVHWARAPRWLGGVQYHVDGYNVTLHYNTSTDGPEVSQPLDYVGSGQELRLTHDVGSASGAYRFGVRISHPACGPAGCHLSYSPKINIKGNSRMFLIVIVSCSVLIPIVLCALHLLKKWCDRPSTEVKPPPILLIVYIPTHEAHIRVVKELAVYLRKFCRVDALLHDIDMPKENMQEPHSWYNKAFDRANYVMVVSSPLQHTGLRDTIYVNVENIALNFLRLKFADPNLPRDKFFCAVLPYCDERDLPEDVRHFRKFSLMSKLDDMLRHVRGGGLRAMVLHRPDVPGGLADYRVHGGQLDAAIEEATREVRRHPGVCTVGYSSSEHTASTLCPQSSTPEVCDEAETSQDRLLEAEPRSRILSPFYLANVRDVARVENGPAGKKPTKRRFFHESMQL